MITRTKYTVLTKRLTESPRPLIQVLFGPRQVGKTTLVLQLKEQLPFPCHYISADNSQTDGLLWIGQQWDNARIMMKLILSWTIKICGCFGSERRV